MQTRGGDADLRAQAQFAAVGKTRRSVDHHHCAAQCVHEERSGGLIVSRGDLAVATNMGDGIVQ